MVGAYYSMQSRKCIAYSVKAEPRAELFGPSHSEYQSRGNVGLQRPFVNHDSELV
jgi:hypothetical protein